MKPVYEELFKQPVDTTWLILDHQFTLKALSSADLGLDLQMIEALIQIASPPMVPHTLGGL